ncbi:ubiquitin-like protein 4A isoform X2 [Alligator mississippiensis]|uniref:ubiquitin-like protein 4A isoform X2 n=1 Tax=Alligator mississippiensis TaxID=8496 RepID=UPI0009073D73|nr:ubiquitin-like protein 4A isoform X2 [Alligator mississippiensis]
MLLTVKALQGRECSLQVREPRSVVEEGQDEHRLSDYAIGPESKLNLVIKPPEKASPEETGCKGSSPATAFPTLWPQLTQVLARHFSTADMEKVLEQLQKDYDRSLRLLSLDDIERLATRILHPDTPDMLEMGFLD